MRLILLITLPAMLAMLVRLTLSIILSAMSATLVELILLMTLPLLVLSARLTSLITCPVSNIHKAYILITCPVCSVSKAYSIAYFVCPVSNLKVMPVRLTSRATGYSGVEQTTNHRFP